jgi:hypothetical protein
MKKKPIHKYNGGAGATICHHCKVIINTGLTEDIYCKDCSDNKVVYHNRYRDKIIFEHIADDTSIDMVDPSGGPYIIIGDNLAKFWPRGEYQNLIVESITLKNGENETTDVIFKVK